MHRTIPIVICITLALAWAVTAAAEAAAPAVARPIAETGGLKSSGGTAFFIRVDNAVGYAAVGTAHGFDLSLLTESSEIHFDLGHSAGRVATSRGLLVPPGRPFTSAGAVLRDDFNVYALAARPKGVRVLELSSRTDLTLGTRVQILGIPKSGARDQAEVFGRIAELSRAHMDVDLDVPVDLRGWGGAPVLDPKANKVLGILEATSSGGGVARVSVAPIDGVRTAIAKLLDDGAGRPFARFAQTSEQRTAAAAGSGKRGRSSHRPPAMSGPLLKQNSDEGTQVQIQIDYPHDGAVISDSICGAFVAGRAVAHRGALRRFDVVLVIDTSLSTADLSGADINGNGVVGEPLLGRLGSVFSIGSTDQGDSILAAEIAAARKLMRGLDPRATRIAVVRFSGEPPGSGGGIFSRGPDRPAVTLQSLTNDYSRVEMALQNILIDQPEGNTHIAAGVDQATIELAWLPGAISTKDPE
ncbi:MAG: hypothetical protein ACYS0F_19520, partial [Planctomycetota bacterium]